MRNFLNLTKVHFLSFYGINKILHSKKNKLFSGVLGLVLLALVIGASIGFMGYTYAQTFALTLTPERLVEIFALMMAYSSLIGFFLSFYATGTLLYSVKDYEMTASLPIKTHVYVLSKLFFMYFIDLLFTLLLMISGGIVYVDLVGGINFDVALRLIALMFLSPLFPLALSILVGAIVALVSSRFNKRNLVQTIMLLGILAICFGSGFSMGMTGLTVDLGKSIGKLYFIFPLAINAVNGYKGLLWFTLVSVLSASAVVTVVCLTYKKMNTLMTARRVRKDFKLKSEYKGKSEFSCLLGKEVKRLLTMPIYLLNTSFGSVIGTIISIVVAIVLPSLLPLEYVAIILPFIPAVYAFMFMLIPTTACSVSVEGSSFWVIKTSPVSARKIINVKLFVGVLFGVIPAFVSATALSIGLIGLPFLILFLMVVLAVLIALLGGNLGLIYNLLFPMMKWDNPNKPVKQGVSVLLSTMTAFVFAALMGVGAYFINLQTEILFAIYAGILLSLVVASYIFLMKKGEKLLLEKT